MAKDYAIVDGKMIRHQRWSLGVTQGELARKVGVSLKTIAGYEGSSTAISLEILEKIAEAQGVNIEYYLHAT